MTRAIACGLVAVSLMVWWPAVAAERSVTFKVDNMTCSLCHITVQKAFETVAGVREVRIERRRSTATIVYDDVTTNVAELAAASTNAGYPATAIAQ